MRGVLDAGYQEPRVVAASPIRGEIVHKPEEQVGFTVRAPAAAGKPGSGQWEVLLLGSLWSPVPPGTALRHGASLIGVTHPGAVASR